MIQKGLKRSDALRVVGEYINEHNLHIIETDLDKPWGGYYVIDPTDEQRFLELFYPGYSRDDMSGGLALRAKILFVMPGAKLSWQYHHRRQEVWTSVIGDVGYITSPDDSEAQLRRLTQGEVVSFDALVRHRLIGLDGYGLIAEFWKHIDPTNPSNEADIVRVLDDFNRH